MLFFAVKCKQSIILRNQFSQHVNSLKGDNIDKSKEIANGLLHTLYIICRIYTNMNEKNTQNNRVFEFSISFSVSVRIGY